MRKYSNKTIATFIRHAIIRTVVVAAMVVSLLSFIYGFVHHYQEKRLHVQQIAEILAHSASAPDGADVVAAQVNMLLDSDSSIQSILFYSTDYPVATFDQDSIEKTNNDWYNALFARTVSFNRAVTSRETQEALTDTVQASNDTTEGDADQATLMGYINITLDVDKMRLQWLRRDLLLWLLTLGLGIALVWSVLRQLNWPSKDITELTKVCEMVSDDPTIKQLPVIQQRFEFQDLRQIRFAFVDLFNRLAAAEKKIAEFAELEQNLRDKDISLDIQRHNFQSMITHELKTSLNAISGGLQLLNTQYLNAEQKDILAIIQKGSHHLDTTLEQIIQLNKIEKGQVGVHISTFSPLQLLSDLLTEFEPIAKQKELELSHRIHHTDYELQGDVHKIKQVLSTLIENAIKFTQVGQITVDSQLSHFNDSIRWQIKVIDTGIGIDNRYFDDIFTPFFQVDPSRTREYEGVGVGLPVVKQMLQLLNASIEVKSNVGSGSEFTVVMPLQNTYHAAEQQQQLLSELSVSYYYNRDDTAMVTMLQGVGAHVISQQYQKATLPVTHIDIIMIAEDIRTEKALQIARYIREHEGDQRAIIVYWYPQHKAAMANEFEYMLKTVGVDYCQPTVSDREVLYALLQKWLGWV